MKTIHPENYYKIIWDFFVGLTVLSFFIITPLTIVLTIKYGPKMLIFDCIVTLIFITDIFLNFNTAYIDGNILVTDKKKIKDKYFKSWFLFDIAAAFPFFLIPGVYGSVYRMIRFIRLLRLLKVFTLFQIINRIKKKKRFQKIMITRHLSQGIYFCYLCIISLLQDQSVYLNLM